MKYCLSILFIFLSFSITIAQEKNKKFRIDTIITFDPNTYEEKIKIVRVKIKKNEKEPKVISDKEMEVEIDTIITFDPKTLKEEIKIVKKTRSPEKNQITRSTIANGFRTDTIITFDPKTYEEKIKVVHTDISNEQSALPKFDSKHGDMQADTIVTFDPDTGKQSIKIVKRKVIEKEENIVEQELKPISFPEGSQEAIDNQLILDYIKQKGLKNVQQTVSGLYYVIDKEGTGAHPNMESLINAHYSGKLLNGTKFDSSYDRGQSLKFNLGQVITGWKISIPLLKTGGKGTFIIPSYLAYGDRNMGKIPSNSVLIFDIELMSFE